MTSKKAINSSTEQAWPYSSLQVIRDDSELVHAINRQIDMLNDEFVNKPIPAYISDLKNPHNALKSLIGKKIYQTLYPGHISTDSARQLLCVITPLNMMASKWRAQYYLDGNPEHYSIGVADYYGNKDHRSVKAITQFEAFIKQNGDFMVRAKGMANDIDMLVADIIRIKPRTEYDFDDPHITFSTGFDDAKRYVEEMIADKLSKYPATPHLAEKESQDHAFYKHLCKNAGIHSILNGGKYLIKENVMMHDAFTEFLHWMAGRVLDVPYITSKEDWQIACCIAAIHAVDRGGRGQIAKQLATNLQEDYIERVSIYVHYLRYSRNKSNKSLTLKLIRKGKTNKEIMIYPVLANIRDDIFSQDPNELLEKTFSHLNERKSNEEITKYAANIFSAITCWEDSYENVTGQIDDYFLYRQNNWIHRNKIMEKLLPLNFEQLTDFHQEIVPILQGEKKRLEVIRDAILNARNHAYL